MKHTFQLNPRPKKLLAVRLALLSAVAAGVVTLIAVVAMNMSSWPWLESALVNRTSLLAGSVGLTSLAGLTLLAIIVMRSRPAKARRPAGEDGTALLEFALILPIALMLILLMIQSALLMAGNLCVHYSAFCAVRAAIVAVPADYTQAGEPPNVVIDDDDNKKMHSIRQAALWALLPISSGHSEITIDADANVLAQGLVQFFSVTGGRVPGWATNVDRLARRMTYADDYTTVTLAGPTGGEGVYGEHEDLVVAINHAFYLGVPYAAKIFSNFTGGGALDFGSGEYGIDIGASGSDTGGVTRRLTNEGAVDFIDIDVIE